MTLKGLCKYYISCVALENNTTLRASMKDERSFIELPWISNKILKSPEIGAFLRGNHDKEKDLLIGYPILKSKHFLSPIFIIHVTYNDGAHGKPMGFTVDDEILINKDIIDKYSTNDKTENIYELRELESELGFTEGQASFADIADKAKLLQTIRPNWEWTDALDYNNLRKGALRVTDADGILNRAVLFAKDPTPYTVGLGNELARLEEMGDLDIRHSILWKFIHKEFFKNKPYDKEILEVLPLNEEQKAAVRSALSADVTLIAGPPGTGKTQVVANLIINAALAGQNVLFTSKNNNAVDVVVKRVNALNKKLPLVLRYEKSAKQCITEYVQQWENARAKETPFFVAFDAYKRVYDSYEAKAEQKRRTMDARNRLDELEQAVCPLRGKYAELIGVLTDQEVNEDQQAYDSFVEGRKNLAEGPFRDAALSSMDRKVLTEMDNTVFCMDTVRSYRQVFNGFHPTHVWRNLDDEMFLRRLGAIGVAADGSLHPTVAGLLMFGYEYEITREFPQYFLDYQENRKMNGTRWTDRIISSSGEWSGNIFDFVYKVSAKLCADLKVPFVMKGMNRVDDTPLHKLLREGITNTLAHADFYGRRGVVIQKMEGKYVFANPGCLRMSQAEAIEGGMSDPRNDTILKMLSLIEYGERSGSGLNGIFMVWQKVFKCKPQLEETIGVDRMVLTLDTDGREPDMEALLSLYETEIDEELDAKTDDKPTINIDVTDKADDKPTINVATDDKFDVILDFLKEKGTSRTADIAKHIGLSVTQTKFYLLHLVRAGKIMPHGANKNRTYSLT